MLSISNTKPFNAVKQYFANRRERREDKRIQRARAEQWARYFAANGGKW